MAREKQRLGVERAGTGWRYRKMYGGKTWTSKVYPSLTRQTKAEAWQNFVEFRQRHSVAQRPGLLSFFKPDGVTLDEEAIKASGLPARAVSREVIRQLCVAAYKSFADLVSHAGDHEGSEEALSKARFLESDETMSLSDLFTTYQHISTFPAWKITAHSLPRIRGRRDASLNAKVLADEYVESYRDKAKREQGSHGQYGLVKRGLTVFTDWFGSNRSMETFDQQEWKRFSESLKKRCDSKEFSSTTAHNYQKVVASFLRHLGSEITELATFRTLNLSSSVHQISPERKEPVTFTPDEVKALLDNSCERTRLYLLLMLNCAMYQQDISDLMASEIDFANGRIIRPRSKTKKANKTNRVPFRFNWLLWPTTSDLLSTLAKRDGVALPNKEGNRLVTHAEKSRRDTVRSAYRRVVDKLKRRKILPKEWNKTLKMLRKTGTNIIAACPDPDTSTFYNQYLNHSTVAQNHYLAGGKPHAKFDEAVRYIGEQLGQYRADTQPVIQVNTDDEAPRTPRRKTKASVKSTRSPGRRIGT